VLWLDIWTVNPRKMPSWLQLSFTLFYFRKDAKERIASVGLERQTVERA
jgi:hypothetical protein